MDTHGFSTQESEEPNTTREGDPEYEEGRHDGRRPPRQRFGAVKPSLQSGRAVGPVPGGWLRRHSASLGRSDALNVDGTRQQPGHNVLIR